MSDGDLTVTLDGIQLQGFCGNGSSQAYHSPINYEEIVFEAASAGADQSAGGIRQHLIPRRGGNTFSGTFAGFYMDPSWQADPLTPELVARGLTQGPSLDGLNNAEGGIGGPLMRDKLWFFFSARRMVADRVIPNAFYRDGSPGIALDKVTNRSLRLTWQATARNQFTADHHWVVKTQLLGVTANTDIETVSRPSLSSPYAQGQVKWTSTVSSKLIVEVGGTDYRAVPADQLSARRVPGPLHAPVVCGCEPNGYLNGPPDNGIGGRTLHHRARPAVRACDRHVCHRLARHQVRHSEQLGQVPGRHRPERRLESALPERCAVPGADLQLARQGTHRDEPEPGSSCRTRGSSGASPCSAVCAGRTIKRRLARRRQATDASFRLAIPRGIPARVAWVGPAHGRHLRRVRRREDGLEVQREQVPGRGDRWAGDRPESRPLAERQRAVARLERRRYRSGRARMHVLDVRLRDQLRPGAGELRHRATRVHDYLFPRFDPLRH